MSITNELRHSIEEAEQVYGCECKHLLALADRIDMEHERLMVERADQYSELRAKMNNCYIELPKDADGEPIHVGDEVEEIDYDGSHHVNELRMRENGWWVSGDGLCRRPHKYRHYHAPTVEDMLKEFANKCLTYATCVDDHEVADAIELYAAKLQLKED